MQLVRDYPDIGEKIFVSKHAQNTTPDADYLYSLFQPQFAEKDTVKEELEEEMMDNLQDFLYEVEDEMVLPRTSIAVWNYPIDVTEKPERVYSTVKN